MKKKIGTKILCMVMVLAIIFVANSAVSLYSLNQIKNEGKTISEDYITLEEEYVNLGRCVERSQKYVNIISLYDNSDLRGSLEMALQADYEEANSRMELMKTAVANIADKKLSAAYDTYAAYVGDIYQAMFDIQGMVDDGDFMGASIALADSFVALVTEGEGYQGAFDEMVSVGVKNAADSYNQAVDRSFYLTIILLTFFIIAIVLIVLLIYRMVVRPAKTACTELADMIEEIEQQEGDLTRRISVKSKDEIGQLVSGVNNFIEQLQHIIKKINADSGSMQQSMNQITDGINVSNEDIGNVSAVLEELAASMEEIAATVEVINAGANDILGNARQMTAETEKGDALVRDIQGRAVQIKHSVNDSKSNTQQMMTEKQLQMQEAIANSKRVEEINGLTGDILEISSQTNLLALNASIEAARAGESGKGFAVVADEIRILADNSRETANNIQQISGNVILAVETLVENANEIITFMDNIVMQDYDQFAGMADQYNEDASSIETMFARFGDSAESLEKTIAQMTEGINGITTAMDESTQGITNAANNSGNLVGTISQIKEEIDNNRTISDSLKQEVERFSNM